MRRNTVSRVALLSAALLGVLVACGGEPDEERDAAGAPTPAGAEPMPEEAAFAAPIEDLRARIDALVAAPLARPDDEAAVERLRGTAAMLRVLALREGSSGALERARELLGLAADADVRGASCRAQADRVRLEALDAGDLARAAAIAHEGARRFEGAERGGHCARRLSDAARALEAAARQGGGGPRALLSRITVYGADAPAPASVRVLFELDRPVDPESVERPAVDGSPRRLWLDFGGAEVGPDVPLELAVNAGGLLELRRAPLPGGSTRVELDLDPRAVVRRFSLDGPFRLVLDVSLPEAAVAGSPSGARAIRRIVLDPGHGGDEWGASSGGVRESHLVFDIARRTAAALSARLPGVEVLLTRDEDVLVTLEQRTQMANDAEADLFVSIHLNDSDVAIQRGGITTFVLDTTDDAQARRLAARENGTTPADVTGMTRLLAELHRSGQVSASRALAERIQAATLVRGRSILPRLADRGVRSALFYVLVGARMPAVLVEASFISHPDELRALRTTGYRQALGEGIAGGIVEYIHGE